MGSLIDLLEAAVDDPVDKISNLCQRVAGLSFELIGERSAFSVCCRQQTQARCRKKIDFIPEL